MENAKSIATVQPETHDHGKVWVTSVLVFAMPKTAPWVERWVGVVGSVDEDGVTEGVGVTDGVDEDVGVADRVGVTDGVAVELEPAVAEALDVADTDGEGD